MSKQHDLAMSKLQAEPSTLASLIVKGIIETGSKKDGIGDKWRNKGSPYHLVKGMAHLALHLKYRNDSRGKDGENHLHKAISRLAMAATIEGSVK